MAVDSSVYLSLITSQHADKPNFRATISALVQPLVDNQTLTAFLIDNAFDLDVAVGVQLDQVGQWVGLPRQVTTPLSGVYFAFDTSGLGFDQGYWQGPYDPLTGITLLDDNTYRAMLRAKILLNRWDGSTPVALKALNEVFALSPGTLVSITDNQDMSMLVGLSGIVPPAALIALLETNEFSIRPVGVEINYLTTSVNGTPLFGFDIETNAISGFDIGSWSGAEVSVVPGAVTGFALLSLTSTSATFTWVAPLIGVALTYQLLIEEGPAGIYTSAGSPVSTTKATVGNLRPGTTYSVAVYAIGSGGAGPLSNIITFTALAGAPGQVQGLRETAQTSTSISLAWTADPAATNYQVQYRQSGTTTYINGPNVTTASATVLNLAAATIYDFIVISSNIYGTSIPSSALTVGTTGSAPGLVTNVSYVSGINDIAFTWSNPTTGNGPFAFIVDYAANSSNPVYQKFTGIITTSATGAACDITGLNTNTSYLVKIAATNLGGNGPFTTPIAVDTLLGPPNQVTGLTVTATTSNSITLSWNAVVNAQYYQTQYRLIGSSNWTNGPLIAVPTTTATLTGLTQPGLTYEFEVYAIGP